MVLVDLSYTFSADDKSNWPGNQVFTKTVVSQGDDNPMSCFIAHYNLCMSEHVGTHMDAPFHFNPKGWTTDQIPLELMVDIPGVVVDISEKCKDDNMAKLEKEDLDAWVEEHGPFPAKCLVLLRSGWGKYYHSNPVEFLGTDKNDESELRYPGFGKTGIDWLMSNTSFVGLGVDTLSIELGRVQGCYVHRTLTAGNKYGLECLANLEQLPAKGFTVTVLPLKIGGGSGGPCRVVAKI